MYCISLQKLPQPRETQCSLGKDVRNHPKVAERELFKMSKFKAVGATLCTQPNAISARRREEEEERRRYAGEDDYEYEED